MQITQPDFDPKTAYWELQAHLAGKPQCYLLKCKGHPYPHGSIVAELGFNPVYKCKAFRCNDRGEIVEILYSDELETIDVSDAQIITMMTFMGE